MLRDHGQSRKYFHDIEGYNGRLDAIQAGLLRVKLRHLAKWNEQRRERARDYDELFANAEGAVVLPHVPIWSRPVYHLYVVRVSDREQLQMGLTAAGIGTGIHYPVPVHQGGCSKPSRERATSGDIGTYGPTLRLRNVRHLLRWARHTAAAGESGCRVRFAWHSNRRHAQRN